MGCSQKLSRKPAIVRTVHRSAIPVSTPIPIPGGDSTRNPMSGGLPSASPSSMEISSPPKSCGDIHCVAVGDTNSGKHHLLSAYEKIDSKRQSAVLFEYHTSRVLGDFSYKFIFSGLSGQEQRHNLRRLSYLRPTGVFLVCFSVLDEVQFHNAVTRWVAEIQENAPGAPYILVGTHADLRKDRALKRRIEKNGRNVISRKAAEKAAQLLGCKYLECSSTTLRGVQRVFEEAIQAALKGPVAEACRKMCRLM